MRGPGALGNFEVGQNVCHEVPSPTILTIPLPSYCEYDCYGQPYPVHCSHDCCGQPYCLDDHTHFYCSGMYIERSGRGAKDPHRSSTHSPAALVLKHDAMFLALRPEAEVSSSGPALIPGNAEEK